MKICGIYKIENNINHKVYIGQSRNIQKRWAQHKWKPFSEDPAISESCPQLYQAIRKYGVNNFTFTILEELPPEELDAREIYWISFYDSFNAGYNMTLGGAGSTAKAREKAVATCLQRYGCKSFCKTPKLGKE